MIAKRTAVLTITGVVVCAILVVARSDDETRFIKAMREGDARTVAALLARKPELAHLKEPHKAGSTPVLYLALSAGHREIVRLLVSHGATPDKYPHALLLARDTEIARFLVEHGADVNRQGKYGETPLHFFAATDNVAMVEFLLDCGGNVDVRNPPGETPLHEAAREGCLNATKLLVARGADINARSKRARTPLEYAALPVWNEDAYRINGDRLRRCQEVGAYLLSCGATGTVFELAWLGDLERLARELASDSSLVNACENGETLLFAAIRGGNADVVGYLLEHGAPVDVTGRFRQMALHVAACVGCVDVVKVLLDHGADVDARGPWGETPLHWVAVRGNVDVASLLLDRGADPDAWTSAHTVDLNVRADDADPVERETAWFQIRERQRRFGGQVAVPPRLAFTTGDTPLHAAAYGNHAEIVKLLIAHGADVAKTNRWGDTALHLAAICGHTDIAEKLLKAGADPQARTHNGVTTVELAGRIKNKKLVGLLSRGTTR